MRTLFLIQGLQHPASRYRALSYVPHLEANGVECDAAVFPASRKGWRALKERLARANAVFLQKKRLNFLQHRFIRKATRAGIVYDVDDAVMYNSSRASSHKSWKRMRAFAATCRRADFVIAGNPYLKSIAERHNKKTAVIPTSIDMRLYPQKQFDPNSRQIMLGWIGGRKSLVFLEELKPVFEALHAKYPQTALKIVCNEFFDCATMPVIKKPWAEQEEGGDVASFDIGLAPLPDDVWSRGKCATKLLQCMAAGVVSVASAVGVQYEIIREGVNGCLASTPEEWEAKLEALILNPEARRTMGDAARRTVEEDYSMAASRPKMLEILTEVMKKHDKW
jgi:hypothetical protein